MGNLATLHNPEVLPVGEYFRRSPSSEIASNSAAVKVHGSSRSELPIEQGNLFIRLNSRGSSRFQCGIITLRYSIATVKSLRGNIEPPWNFVRVILVKNRDRLFLANSKFRISDSCQFLMEGNPREENWTHVRDNRGERPVTGTVFSPPPRILWKIKVY